MEEKWLNELEIEKWKNEKIKRERKNLEKVKEFVKLNIIINILFIIY
jgi:hypothetical protein